MSLLPKDNSILDKLVFYVLFLLITFSAVVVFNFLGIAMPISVTTSNRTSELAVVGEGKVDVVPDTIYVDLGISVTNVATAQEAQKKIDDVNNKIIASLKSVGVDAKNIRTSSYSITPGYNFLPTSENKITGYNGNAQVEVKLTDAKLVTQVINQATAAGANEVQGTRFTIDNPEKYREQARNEAIANARDQAGKLAQSLGIRLGNVENIVESAPDNVYPMEAKSLAAPAAVGGSGPQIEPGTQTVTSTVTLYFEKK